MVSVALKRVKAAVALQTNGKTRDYASLLYGGASLLLIVFGWQVVAWTVDWWRGVPVATSRIRRRRAGFYCMETVIFEPAGSKLLSIFKYRDVFYV